MVNFNKIAYCKLLAGFLFLTATMIVFGCDGGEVVDEANGGAEGVVDVSEEVELIDDFIILATTTSTYDSGLLDYINPIFKERTGLEVQVVSQGTGAALESGSRGDVDVLLVHDRVSELQLVAEGDFVDRYDVMYNDFIIVGPETDPAGVTAITSVVNALTLVYEAGEPFISRGDDSGTHRMEERLWASTDLNPDGQDWYNSIGQGMGDTLNMANEVMGYAMTDRGTYVAMGNNLDLIIVLEGDPVLFNQYGVMAVNPDEHPHVKYDYAMVYLEFLMSDAGQDLINSYQVNGETLFFPGYGLK